jgi:subtilase family serine protease
MLKQRTWAVYTAALAAAVLTGAAGLAGASAASAGRGAASAGAVMSPVGTAPGIPPGARVTGPAARSATLRITVALRSADPRGLDRLAAEVSTPGSARFRHFLHPRRIQARFGPPQAATAAVRAWLRSYHLSTSPALGDGLLLPAAGPVARIEAAFRTTIDRVRLADGRTALLNRRAPEVPASLRRWVSAVIGLDNVHLPGTDLSPGRVPGPRACRAARTTRHMYTAAWLAHAYGFHPLYRRRDFGQHVTVALFELADYANRDIRAYDRCYRVHPALRRVRVNGGTTVTASGDGTLEVTADIEVVAAMAPRARILAYEAPLSGGDQSIVDTYGAIAQQDRAQVVSSSWDGCEPLAGAAVVRVEAQLFQEMALQGQSVMAAAGDSGSEGCLPDAKEVPARIAYSLQVGNPASQPFVTAVGGTIITRYGSPPVQSAWNQTPAGMGFPAPFNGRHGRPGKYPGNLAGSGGISRMWWMPSWQAGFVRPGHRSGARCGARHGTGCREVPDVSALAAIGTRGTRGYVIYGTAGAFKGKGWLTVGGTSLATPLWAALTALADQQAAAHRLGLLSPSLYRIARHDPRALTDVVAGNNDYLAAHGRHAHHACRSGGRRRRPCYPATRGYDISTGLGSPQAGYLVTDLLRESRDPPAGDAPRIGLDRWTGPGGRLPA